MNIDLQLRAGDWVEVRTKEEIVRTLDVKGQLDGLPFMPEMFAFCGRRFRVFKRAHKTCDTATGAATGVYKGRRMKETVHLDGIRCDGSSHGGCEAGCLIFWKQAWLQKVSDSKEDPGMRSDDPDEGKIRCTEKDVLNRAVNFGNGETVPTYICQTTSIPNATEPLSPWDLRQYFQDISSRNVGLGRMANGFLYMAYKWLALRMRGGRILRYLYDRSAGLRGGYPFPRKHGKILIGSQTPSVQLNLREGELVRVKSYEAILATCDAANKNRGMVFDAEMVPYCGRTFRVLKRVTKILNESTGRMQQLKNPCIILDGVTCQSRYSECRLFCPRSIYPYWREVWLERVNEPSVEVAHVSAPGECAVT